MIVQRIVWNVKHGCADKVIELLLPYLRSDDSPLRRVYKPSIGPLDVIVGEFEFEDLGEIPKAWAEWSASPEAAEFMPKWYEMVERGGYAETWELVE